MGLRPVAPRRSVSDEVFDQLSAEIVYGHLAPGDPLPAERSLTQALGVNRQAVREALKRLEQAGLVDIQHGGATRVADFRRRASLDLLPMVLLRADGSIDPAVVRAILELRGAVGPDVARRCAERALRALVDELEAVVDAIAETPADDLERLGELDTALWELLVEGSDNIAYRLAYNGLRATYGPIEASLRTVMAPELADLDDKRAIVAAVADGDGNAADAAARRLLARGAAALTTAVAERS
jgi:GntR family transcriptional repressor for pyruvate dehydrogenase complex